MSILSIHNLEIALQVLGAVSGFCSVMSKILPGKAGAVFGEIGVDISGALSAMKDKP